MFTNIRNRIGLQGKIFAVLMLAIFIWTSIMGVVMIFGNKRLDLENEEKYLLETTEVFAELLVVNLEEKDYSSINRLAEHVLYKQDIKYWIVFNERGKVVADNSYQLKGLTDKLSEKALASEGKLIQKHTLDKKQIGDISAPIKSESSRLGTVRLGFSYDEIYKKVNDRINYNLKSSFIVGLLAMVFVGVFSLFFTKTMKDPTKTFLTVSEEITKGNFSKLADVDLKGKTDPLTRAFNKITGDLMLLVEKVRGAVDRLRRSASSLFSLSEQQATASVEQAASVSEVTTTTEELNIISKQIAENTSLASAVSRETLNNIEEGQRTMEDAVKAIENIRTKSSESTKGVIALEEKIQQVNSVVEIIDSIASKTNLLALNAAIEAVRAGEGGKGFAVVASEIRKLAENVIESTSEIKDIITDIQLSTRTSVVVAEDVARETEKGTEFIFKTSNIFRVAFDQTKKLTVLGSQISSATSQQKIANEQLVDAMREISQTAEHFAKSSQKIMALVEDLNNITENLELGIKSFGAQEVESNDQSIRKERIHAAVQH